MSLTWLKKNQNSQCLSWTWFRRADSSQTAHGLPGKNALSNREVAFVYHVVRYLSYWYQHTSVWHSLVLFIVAIEEDGWQNKEVSDFEQSNFCRAEQILKDKWRRQCSCWACAVLPTSNPPITGNYYINFIVIGASQPPIHQSLATTI